MMERKIEWIFIQSKELSKDEETFFFFDDVFDGFGGIEEVEGTKICSVRNNRDVFIDHPVHVIFFMVQLQRVNG